MSGTEIKRSFTVGGIYRDPWTQDDIDEALKGLQQEIDKAIAVQIGIFNATHRQVELWSL